MNCHPCDRNRPAKALLLRPTTLRFETGCPARSLIPTAACGRLSVDCMRLERCRTLRIGSAVQKKSVLIMKSRPVASNRRIGTLIASAAFIVIYCQGAGYTDLL